MADRERVKIVARNLGQDTERRIEELASDYDIDLVEIASGDDRRNVTIVTECGEVEWDPDSEDEFDSAFVGVLCGFEKNTTERE